MLFFSAMASCRDDPFRLAANFMKTRVNHIIVPYNDVDM
jgi:hypothetical protein